MTNRLRIARFDRNARGIDCAAKRDNVIGAGDQRTGEGAPCVVKIADDKGSMLHELKTHPVLVYGKDYEIAPDHAGPCDIGESARGCKLMKSGVSLAKAKNADPILKAAGEAGDAWLWMATDAETKIVPCWHVGSRDGEAAMEFVDDLASRLENRVQITTDGHNAYLDAIDTVFGGRVDYAMLVKLFGPAPEGARRYSPAECLEPSRRRFKAILI